MQAGQKVDVRLDAYPEMVFHGHLDLISSVGVSDDFSQKLHTFMMLFVIDGKDAKLLPDLSAAVDVELERLPNVLIVPRDSLVSEDGKFNVRVLSSNSSEKREVRVLQINDVDAAVEAKLQPGETVIRGVAPEVIQVASASAATPKK
jgi:HlyD family secretion protein